MDAVAQWVKDGNSPEKFPVRDWEKRLENHQHLGLEAIFDKEKRITEGTFKWGEHLYDQQQVVHDAMIAKRLRQREYREEYREASPVAMSMIREPGYSRFTPSRKSLSRSPPRGVTVL